VTQQERTLQNLLISLAETKKSNTLTEEINSLDLQSQSNAIDKQKEELEELKKSSGTLVVTSKNAGVVSSVGFAAGDTVNAGDVLANITLTDSGYTLQFTVTAEQARKLKTGMKADITNDYYSDITAQLVSMKTDTEHSGSTDRILTFEISGSDVTPGQSLSLSLSCSSQSYDCVVPTSAIMEDTEGKFVLIVNAKSTPLGNKYFASRVAVTVLASDELNSAVQGDLNSWDFVITASEKPLSNGKQIRMED
jgi:multidrug efflux pump subunit AcrA (membrane-fusion protein)